MSYDNWKSTNPADEELGMCGADEEDENEPEAPSPAPPVGTEAQSRAKGAADAQELFKTVREVLATECSSYCLDNAGEITLVTRAVCMRLLLNGWRR